MTPIPYSVLLDRLHKEKLVTDGYPSTGPDIRHVTCDSRLVTAGTCFVAVRGMRADGQDYVGDAVARGAVMVVSESAQAARGAVHLRVTSVREALALCAAAVCRDPARQLACCGITGTNGKTTTAWLLHHALMALGNRSGLLGTIAYTYGATSVAAPLTTPDAPDLQRMLREMVNAGCTTCVMEVSSHALDQRRVHGIPFSTGIFTNLGHDHLDYHKTRVAYARAKKHLFDTLSPDAVAIYNADDPAGAGMVQDTGAVTISYGQSPGVDMSFSQVCDSSGGLELHLDGSLLKTRLSGAFNAYNVAAAYAAACARGHAAQRVRTALGGAPPAPGRFELIRFADNTLAIVDFAHTPDALRKALNTARDHARTKALWCVFGCGGDRDKAKRPLMGAIAERLADHVVVTSDNSRSESYHAISRDIREGMQDPSEAAWIEDRREAVDYAAQHATPGDVVLIAGKGHETTQLTGTEKRPLNDRALVLDTFAHRVHID